MSRGPHSIRRYPRPVPEEGVDTQPMPWSHLRELEIEPPSWLVKPFLHTGSVAIMYGDSQAGKTWLAFFWSLQLASEGARVLILEGEGSLGETRSRIRLLAKGLGVDEQKLGDRLHVWQDSPVDRRDLDEVNHLLEASRGFDLVVVDTVSAHAPGSDEGAGEMSLMLHALRGLRTGARAAVLAIHHITKAAAQGSRVSMSNASGHSNMKRLADTMLEVVGRDTQDRRIGFTINVTKQRGAPRAEPTPGELRIDNVEAVFTWQRRPEHRAPEFGDDELAALVRELPVDGSSLGIRPLSRALRRREVDVRRLAKVCEERGLIDRDNKGVRRRMGASPHALLTPDPSRTGQELAGTTPPPTPIPSPLYGDGWDGGGQRPVSQTAQSTDPIPKRPDGQGHAQKETTLALNGVTGPLLGATTSQPKLEDLRDA